MREILFRGKLAYNGVWVYGGFYKEPVDDIKDGKTYIITGSLSFAGNANQVIPETIGQFTGLLDKHGRKIFEGDIVKITDHTIEETFESCGDLVTMLMTRNYEVFWNTTKWSIKSLEPMLTADPPIFDLPTNHATYEIIGNIHDSPEALS